MGPGEMQAIAGLIGRTLRARSDEAEVAAVRSEVADAVRRLPALSRSLGVGVPDLGWYVLVLAWSRPERPLP